MDKRGQGMTWGHILSMVVVVVLVLFSLYFIKVYVVDPSSQISSCESHGGTCQASPCHPVKQWPMSYSCKDKDEQCCIYRTGYSKETEDILAQGSSGVVLREGHEIYAYTISGSEVVKISADKETLPMSDEPYAYYFAAQGEEVGVCYASLMATKNGKRTVVQRIMMDRDECEELDHSKKKPLTFKLDETAKKEYKDISLQFIVFPKEWGTTVSKFSSDPKNKDYWTLKSKEWVGSFIKPITIGEPSCDYYDKLSLQKKKKGCMGNDNCVWCPANDRCLTVAETEEDTCNEECYADSYSDSLLIKYFYDSNEKMCQPDEDFCKSHLRLEYDFTDSTQIKILCYPKECCGDKLKFGFSNRYGDSNFCQEIDLLDFKDDKRVVLYEEFVDNGCYSRVDNNYLNVLIAGKNDYTKIPSDNIFYHYESDYYSDSY